MQRRRPSDMPGCLRPAAGPLGVTSRLVFVEKGRRTAKRVV